MCRTILIVAIGFATQTYPLLVAAENRFEAEIQRFEEADKVNPPPKDAVLFIGSSSIRFWKTLEQDFPGIEVINRGFGGAQFSDVIHFLDRVVIPYQPRAIVIYAGSHDLRREGGGPGEVLKMFTEFREAVQAKLPRTRICYISMKPSIQKWETIHLDREANRLIKEYCEKTPGVQFIDIWTPMVVKSSPPPGKYFKPDLNHPSSEGYRLWASVIRPFIELRPTDTQNAEPVLPSDENKLRR